MGRQNLCKGNKVSWAFQANRTKSRKDRKLLSDWKLGWGVAGEFCESCENVE